MRSSGLFAHNLVYGNTNGVFLDGTSQAIGNTVVGSGTGLYCPYTGLVTCNNNIVVGFATGFMESVSFNKYRAYNNVVYDCTADFKNIIDVDTIEADPLFVNAAINDYRLQEESPARSAGIDAGELTNNASYIDIGAIQSQPVTKLLGLVTL